ncbi:hypothetical protein Esti_004250 [Eimeria stiedai]
MPVELIAPALLAKGAGVHGATSSLLGVPGDILQMTPAGMAMGALGGITNGVVQQAASHGAGTAGGVVEESLYLLPLLPLPFTSAPRRLPGGGESRTIRLSTADSRGARYAEFL